MKRHFIYARAWPGWINTQVLSQFLHLPDDKVCSALDEAAKRWDADHPRMVTKLRNVRKAEIRLRAMAREPYDAQGRRLDWKNLRLPDPHLLDDVAILAGWAIYPPGPYSVSPGGSFFYPTGFQLFHGCETKATAETVVELLRSNCQFLSRQDSFFDGCALVQFELTGRSSPEDRARQAQTLADRQAEGLLASGWLGDLAGHAAEYERTLEESERAAAPERSEEPPLPSAVVSHGEGFAWLRTLSTFYKFDRPQQRQVIRKLFEVWRAAGDKDGTPVTTEELRTAVESQAVRFSVSKLFDGHDALGRILRKHGKDAWALHLNSEHGETPEPEKGTQNAR